MAVRSLPGVLGGLTVTDVVRRFIGNVNYMTDDKVSRYWVAFAMIEATIILFLILKLHGQD